MSENNKTTLASTRLCFQLCHVAIKTLELESVKTRQDTTVISVSSVSSYRQLPVSLA